MKATTAKAEIKRGEVITIEKFIVSSKQKAAIEIENQLAFTNRELPEDHPPAKFIQIKKFGEENLPNMDDIGDISLSDDDDPDAWLDNL